MKKVPISLIVDDPAPGVSVYYYHDIHGDNPVTEDGRSLMKMYPNSFLNDFCDMVDRWRMKGKFSVIPMPANQGDIINGITGMENSQLKEWLDIVKERLVPAFSICPELITHTVAIDVNTGKSLEMPERIWANAQDRTTITPYISYAYSILKKAGFECSGVTSPGTFGLQVEGEMVASIAQATYAIFEKKNSWHFLRSLAGVPGGKPWVEYDDGDKCVVDIPATTNDATWQTINCTDTSDEYISRVADRTITADGKGGQIIDVLETGGYPVLFSHWQGLASNGLYTGLKAMNEIGRRINEHLSDKVEWMSYDEILEMVVNDKKSYPKPDFENIVENLLNNEWVRSRPDFSEEDIRTNPYFKVYK